MKKSHVFILLAVILATLVASARPRKARGPASDDVAKADYLFLEALHARSQDRHDAAYELLERSYALNPDLETGFELARYLLAVPQDDSLARALSLMRGYWDANPADMHAGTRYGIIVSQLGLKPEERRVWGRLHTIFPDEANISLIYAQVLGATGDAADFRRAVEIYDSMELAEGPSIELSGKKIQLFYMQNDTAAIIAEADRLRQARPRDADFAVYSGDIYSMFGRDDEALRFYDEACALDPSNGYAYYSKAQYFKAKNDSVAYDREVYNALRQESLGVDNKLQILRSYISQFYTDTLQQPRIRELFDTLVVIHPLEHDIHELYAQYLGSTGLYAEAAEQEEQTLGLDPADLKGWDLLSSLYITVDNMPKAKDAIERGLRYYPEDPSLWLKKGSLLNMDKDYEAGADALVKALELTDSTDVDALSSIYTAIADNLQQRELSDSAFALYDKAILFDPDNLLALNNYAYFLAVSDRNLDKALEMIERVMAKESDNPTSLDTYAWVLFRRNDYDKARSVIDSCLELTAGEPDSDIVEILSHAGDIYFMTKEPAKAMEFWKRALKADPSDAVLREKVKRKSIYVEDY